MWWGVLSPPVSVGAWLLTAGAALMGTALLQPARPDPLATDLDCFMINLDRVLRGGAKNSGMLTGVCYTEGEAPSREAACQGFRETVDLHPRLRCIAVEETEVLKSAFVPYLAFDIEEHVGWCEVEDGG